MTRILAQNLVLAFTFSCLELALPTSSALSDDQITIVPNPAIQSQIRELTKAIEQGGKEGSQEQFLKAVLTLGEVPDQTELIRQLIWYLSQSKELAEGMTIPFAIHYCEISPFQVAGVVAPLVGRAGSARLNKAAAEFAEISESSSPPGNPDFTHYAHHIAATIRANAEVNLGLIAHMIRRSPGSAVEALATSGFIADPDKKKSALWAAHIVDDALWKQRYGFLAPRQSDATAAAEIAKMAAREEWWARLYAAEIIQKHPEYYDAKTVRALADDADSYVRETAGKIRPPILQ